MEIARILIGIIGIIGVNIAPSTYAAALNNSKIEPNAVGRIISVLNYHNYQKLSASFSSTDEYYDFDREYLLFDCKEFANSFNEFKERYPTFTIIARGQAESYSTFGDVGRDKFGALIYSTNFFINQFSNFATIVNASDEKWFTYYVKVTIAIILRRLNTKLIAIPYINGTLTSHGFETRHLHFGLTVETITFNPKDYE
ncbi:hypothetical protein PV327_010726 [Microctonus hyperodae]|uniref:Uncharacterized protein n=1 Tax=Microctonus hyperodae TaxID=165561 RepID=A0AA39EXZ5_MICHY|nr:hypothetical protein PV327_010726 [Microctonus hyperodae]